MLFLECYVTCYQYTFIATGTGYYLKLFARIWTSLNQSFVWLAERKNAMQKIINLMCAKVDFWALRQRCSFYPARCVYVDSIADFDLDVFDFSHCAILVDGYGQIGANLEGTSRY